MSKSLLPRAALWLCLGSLLGCVHGAAKRPAQLSPASQALASEADAVGVIRYEEDYFEAKLLYQALPETAPQRARLRAKLLEYLLGPIASLDAERLRKHPEMLGTEDDFDRLADSFREALEAFSPSSLWLPGGPPLAARERSLLTDAA
jgi:hypothetical protein